jgi:hypothetical protein
MGSLKSFKFTYLLEIFRLLVSFYALGTFMVLWFFLSELMKVPLDDCTEGSLTIRNLFWCEWICFLVNIFSGSIYLLLRFFIKHKLYPESWIKNQNFPPDEETLFAQRRLVWMLMNTIAPYAISRNLNQYEYPAPFTIPKSQHAQLQVMSATSLHSILIVFMIIFVDYKKGSKWFKAISPYVFLGSIWVKCIYFPIINIGYLVKTLKTETLRDFGNAYACW